MKKTVYILFIILLPLIFISCDEKIIYSKPTSSQVNDFINRESINVKTIKEASEFTVIVYQDGKNSGHHVLYQDQDGKLYNHPVYATSNEVNKVNLGGVASGKEPFVTVIINDEDLYKQAKYLEVTFDDGNIIREEVTEMGIVVLYNNEDNIKPISYSKVAIYDKDDNVIYEY